MRIDYHIHTAHSPDCAVPMEQQLRRAAEMGVTELCLTDHLELGLAMWNNEETDLVAYRDEYERLRDCFPGLTVKFGVEAGISCDEAHFPRLKQTMKSMDFDFVIASAHTLRGKNVLRDFPFEGDGMAQVCREYIPSITRRLKALDPDSYSCVGHIDFPWKGALRLHLPRAEYRYDYAPDAMDELFRFLVEQGKCLELNTSPWALAPAEELVKPDWLRRYVQLGGEFITIGSDSHRLENTGAFFREAVEWALFSGVKYLAVYDKMQPRFIPMAKI